ERRDHAVHGQGRRLGAAGDERRRQDRKARGGTCTGRPARAGEVGRDEVGSAGEEIGRRGLLASGTPRKTEAAPSGAVSICAVSTSSPRGDGRGGGRSGESATSRGPPRRERRFASWKPSCSRSSTASRSAASMRWLRSATRWSTASSA